MVRSCKLAIRAAIVIVLILGLGVGARHVEAVAVDWDGGAGNGLWSDPLNWSGDTLPLSGDTISISGSAGEVVLDTDFTLVGKLTIDGNGTALRIESGVTLTLDPILAPGQYDTVIVDNGGTLINDGVVEGVDLSPLSRILVTSTESTFINNDTLNVLEVSLRGSATLNNDGTMNT
ncbi:MAG: hypothetical protein ISS58_02075, partial [Dehalococcoidales bacterium]|nr:hypothetical protein [Dehalococcoidales bacterium]